MRRIQLPAEHPELRCAAGTSSSMGLRRAITSAHPDRRLQPTPAPSGRRSARRPTPRDSNPSTSHRRRHVRDRCLTSTSDRHTLQAEPQSAAGEPRLGRSSHVEQQLGPRSSRSPSPPRSRLPSPSRSRLPSRSRSEEASGEQSVEAGTGTPEESTPDGALFGTAPARCRPSPSA